MIKPHNKIKHRKWWLDRKSRKAKKDSHTFTSRIQYLIAPEIMDFNEHCEETLRYFDLLRSINKKIHFWIDLKQLRKITPAAAITLLSEIDQLSVRLNVSLNIKDFNKWDNDIRTQLRDMGMFQCLKISKRVANKITTPHTPLEHIKYFTFKKAYSFDIDYRSQLLNDIENFIKSVLPKKNELEVVISEAAANVADHAYELCPDIDNKFKAWWLSASYDINKQVLTIIFIDHGVGIPKMLEKKFANYVKSFFTNSTNDTIMIQKATELGVSRFRLDNRGKGLSAIKDYAKTTDNSHIRILSYLGDYMFANGGKEELRSFKTPLKGTLIEWNIGVKK